MGHLLVLTLTVAVSLVAAAASAQETITQVVPASAESIIDYDAPTYRSKPVFRDDQGVATGEFGDLWFEPSGSNPRWFFQFEAVEPTADLSANPARSYFVKFAAPIRAYSVDGITLEPIGTPTLAMHDTQWDVKYLDGTSTLPADIVTLAPNEGPGSSTWTFDVTTFVSGVGSRSVFSIDISGVFPTDNLSLAELNLRQRNTWPWLVAQYSDAPVSRDTASSFGSVKALYGGAR